MRGSDSRSGALFSYVDLEARVRRDHPLRAIRRFADTALEALTGEFAQLYSGVGRPSIAPEMLLRAMLVQAFYSIRSERQLMERLEFDLLFRWFAGLGMDDPAWDHSTFSKNRDRLLDGEIAARFLAAACADQGLISSSIFEPDLLCSTRADGAVGAVSISQATLDAVALALDTLGWTPEQIAAMARPRSRSRE
jgi:transposase